MPKSSIYGAAAAEIWELFGDYVSGDESAVALVVSSAPLGDEARIALQKSLASLGYGSQPCTFASLSSAASPLLLDASAIFMLVEGLDPVCIICADDAAATALEGAYRCAVPRDAFSHVFGRPAAVFQDFAAMLGSDDDKQRAWAILKRLPKA